MSDCPSPLCPAPPLGAALVQAQIGRCRRSAQTLNLQTEFGFISVAIAAGSQLLPLEPSLELPVLLELPADVASAPKNRSLEVQTWLQGSV